MLETVQNELFDLGADLATPGEDFAPSDMALRIVAAQVERLEREIDAMNAGLEPLRSFILPGGVRAVARICIWRGRSPAGPSAAAVAAARETNRSTRGARSISTACPIICSSPRACRREPRRRHAVAARRTRGD